METILKAYDNMPNVQSQMLTSQLGYSGAMAGFSSD